MGAIVCGWEFPGLKKDAVFEGFKEQEPLQAPGSPGVIFAHERIHLRTLETQDSFKDLPTAELPLLIPNSGVGCGHDRSCRKRHIVELS